MTEQNAIDELKTPLFAAIGAGDYAYEAVSDVIDKLRHAATDASKDFETRVDEARAKVEEAAGTAQAKLTEAKDGLPKDADELRAKFTPEELRKVAAAYIQVATDIYESLAERGESAFEKIRSGSVVEDATEQANKAYTQAVGLTESSLGQVSGRARQVGERAAKLIGRGTEAVIDAADEAGDKAAKAAGKASDQAAKAADKVSDQAAKAADKVSDQAAKTGDKAAKTASNTGAKVAAAADQAADEVDKAK